eukprot:1961070-Pyramimonas_sp.AAC.1
MTLLRWHERKPTQDLVRCRCCQQHCRGFEGFGRIKHLGIFNQDAQWIFHPVGRGGVAQVAQERNQVRPPYRAGRIRRSAQRRIQQPAGTGQY